MLLFFLRNSIIPKRTTGVLLLFFLIFRHSASAFPGYSRYFYENGTFRHLWECINYQPDVALLTSRKKFLENRDYSWKLMEVRSLSEMGQYEQALKISHRSLRILREHSNMHLVARFHLEIAYTNTIYGNIPEAQRHYNHVLQLAIMYRDDDLYWGVCSEIAGIYIRTSQPVKSLSGFRKIYLNCQRAKMQDITKFRNQCLANMAISFNLMGKHDSAIYYSRPIYRYFRKKQFLKNLFLIARTMAASFASGNQTDSSLRYSLESLAIARKLKAPDIISFSYEMLSDHYKQRGEYKLALTMKDSAEHYFQAFMNRQHLLSIDELNSRFKLSEKNLQLTRNKLAFRRQQYTFQNQRSQLRLALLSFSLIVVIFMLWRFFRQKQKKQAIQHQLIELELKALRAQMNPHFLFNCLSTIQHLFMIKSEIEANNYMTKFSRLLRSVLENSKRETVSLREEICTLELYCELECLQFRNPFQLYIDANLSAELLCIEIPPMLLQPFVENAIRHGFDDTRNNLLRISFRIDGRSLICVIDDDGIGREASRLKQQSGFTEHISRGMDITLSRIRLLKKSSGKDASFRITDKYHPDGSAAGTRILITISL